MDGTVGRMFTPIFSFFRKRVLIIKIWEMRPVLNERSGNFTFYRGIHEFLNSIFFEKIVDIKLYAVVSIWGRS